MSVPLENNPRMSVPLENNPRMSKAVKIKVKVKFTI
jgi:hypothetical protein